MTSCFNENSIMMDHRLKYLFRWKGFLIFFEFLRKEYHFVVFNSFHLKLKNKINFQFFSYQNFLRISRSIFKKVKNTIWYTTTLTACVFFVTTYHSIVSPVCIARIFFFLYENFCKNIIIFDKKLSSIILII